MSIPKQPPKAQLLLSVFSSDWEQFWPNLLKKLEARFGPADMVSEPLSFKDTTYYHREFGAPLTRRLLGFQELVDQDQLVGIKLWTHALEQEHSRSGGRRLFNLDPGLLTMERLVLATGKNFAHRIYLGAGIFADLTLVYRNRGWKTLPWTFPDYAGETLQSLLENMRQAYREKLAALQVNK
ncbi:MAG TPA: DUF4416 family protein [Desulfonatronum sp.]|nr:DUF4416 family protein [Desulfonatronum sp.]